MTHWRTHGSYQSIDEYNDHQLKQISNFRVLWMTLTLALFLGAGWLGLAYGL